MKKCSHCNREIMNDAEKCPFCGGDIDNALEVEGGIATNSTTDAPPLPEQKEASFKAEGSTTPLPPNKAMVWLILSSILTFFGCFCFGVGIFQIPTIITSAIAQGRYSRGEYEDSERLARTSKILFFTMLAISVAIIIGVVVMYYNIFDMVGGLDEFYY